MSAMTVFDYSVLAIVGFSILVGLMRGAIREIFSIAGWVLSFYLAKKFNTQAIGYLPDQIPGETIKVIAAFLLVFLLVLLLCSLFSIVLTSLVKAVGLGGVNRLLGGLAGAFRGLLFVCILVMLAGMTDLPKDTRWSSAMFSAPLEAMVIRLLPWMPASIADRVHFDTPPPDIEI